MQGKSIEDIENDLHKNINLDEQHKIYKKFFNEKDNKEPVDPDAEAKK